MKATSFGTILLVVTIAWLFQTVESTCTIDVINDAGVSYYQTVTATLDGNFATASFSAGTCTVIDKTYDSSSGAAYLTIRCTSGGGSSNTLTITTTTGATCSQSLNILKTISLDTAITHLPCYTSGDVGQVVLTVSDGPGGPYVFYFSDQFTVTYTTTKATITNLAPGSYGGQVTSRAHPTVTLTFTFNVYRPSAVYATYAITEPSCHGGSNGQLTIYGKGGQGSGYTYNFGSGATSSGTKTGLTAGSYSVTVADSNGCSYTNSYTVGQPTALQVTAITTQHVTCYGDTNGLLYVQGSGGVGTITYQWDQGKGTNPTITSLAAGTYTVTIRDSNACTLPQPYTIQTPSIPAATYTITHVGCKGASTGSITANPTGGTAPYSYLWGNSATTQTVSGLPVRTITSTIKDSRNCAVDQSSLTITEPAAELSITTTKTDVLCRNALTGVATVTATGGTTPYSYAWTGGFTTSSITGKAAGSYTITVTDAKGCTKTETVTITQPATALTSPTTQTNVACNGAATGSATVTPTGGTGTKTIQWSGGSLSSTSATVSNLVARAYTVVVTDVNSCTSTSTVTITEPAAFSVTKTTTSIACHGGTSNVVITASGGASPYTYEWPSGTTSVATNQLGAGAYSIAVKDTAQCSVTLSFTLNAPTAISVTDVTTNPQCFGGTGTSTLTATGGTGSKTYSWSPSGGSSATATLAAGTYTATVTDASSCTATHSVTVTAPAALSIVPTYTDVTCFGTSTGTATATASGGSGSYTYVWSPNVGSTATVSNLASGTYTVTVTDSQATSCTAATHTFTISQPTQLTLSNPIQTDVLCRGASTGTATVTVTGGTPTYTYSWAPSGQTTAVATNLAAGTHTVTVTDTKGCTQTHTFTITQPANAFSVAATATNHVLCYGGATGSVTVEASYGAGAISYSWSNTQTGATATGLTIGTYTATATDTNSCTATVSVTITEPTDIVITPTQTNVDCHGSSTGSASITATGGNGAYTYAWANIGQTSSTASGLVAGSYSVVLTDANLCTKTTAFTITEPAALALTPTHTDILCHGASTGTAQIAATGGTSSYTYLWSNQATTASISALVAGVYDVTVTDAHSCTATESITVTQPAAIVLTPSQSDVLCNAGNSGSASVSATGGTGAYTYSWTNGVTTAGASSLIAGSYTVTVTDANSCVKTHAFTITEPTVVVLTKAQTDVLCNGDSTGAAEVTASGGVSGYTYLWSNGETTSQVSDLVAGSYSVDVTDSNQCLHTASYIITEPTALAVSPAHTDVLCHAGNSGTAQVTASGGVSGYTYLWSTGATTAQISSLTIGDYAVTITDTHQCVINTTITVIEPEPLAITFTSANVSCHGGNSGSASAHVTGGTTAYSYLWSTGSTSADISSLTIGDYKVTVTDAHSCVKEETVRITQPTPVVANNGDKKDVSCHGGSDGFATAISSGGTGDHTYTWSNGATNATASNLVVGSYSVVVADANLCSQTLYFTVNEPTPVVLIPVQVNVSCNGASSGGAQVLASGGTPGYTYLWSNGKKTSTITRLPVGTYNVTVTDALQCVHNTSVTLYQPEPLVAIIVNATDNVCYNGSAGSADVTVSGGVEPYVYNWSTLVNTSLLTGIRSGNYSVIVTDDNGCSVRPTVAISEPARFCVHGDCIGLSQCACWSGWNGTDCSLPICEEGCNNGGNCTAPETCVCTKDWTGPSCSVPTDSVNGTQKASYIVTLVQVYKQEVNVSMEVYKEMLSDKLGLVSQNISVRVEPFNITTQKRAILPYFKLISDIKISNSTISRNKTVTNVLDAANALDIYTYLTGNSTDNDVPLTYVDKVELIITTAPPTQPPTPPPVIKHKPDHTRRIKLGLGIGLGLGIPVTVSIIVGIYSFNKKKIRFVNQQL